MTKYICALLLSLGWCGSAISSVNAAVTDQVISKPLNEEVSVAGQMDLVKFQQLLKQGFKSVIVNRPDGELGNPVTVNQLRTVAEKSHVSLIYQPVESVKVSQPDIVEFARYYNSLPKPILLVCRSGGRSTALFNQAKQQGLLRE
ncbi:sulfur transferase domain-containing protein [Acinetobacter radioresistens]|uniref:beta-lactamase hydrolase domain-containing protein n=1 Tax=Acinetobacter radioresistens TaxID=40216 RepID=UPI000C339B7B|nr:sulfur transferase domain-containing protein [Acinetobacter radioresistens]MCX0331507.1 sulfur transferase domain-containing protein [Acinetobacter radioresistens]PKH31384.1 hypothetical protein BJF94_07230 [Acinetobacter radioresistens]